MKALPVFDSFTFIPMLTEEDAGKKKVPQEILKKPQNSARPAARTRILSAIWSAYRKSMTDLEYFQTISAYFKKENIVGVLHDHPFSHEGRDRYFGNVLPHLQKKPVIFLDPDIGLEESKPTKKHLLFEELKKISGKIDPQSVLMIYQHFPREKHEGYIRRRCSEIHAATGIHPVTITDNEIVFFYLIKNPRLHQTIEDVFSLFADTYPARSSRNCE